MVMLDENYWSERYKLGMTGWDIGYPSAPLVQYLDQFENKAISLLIPGSGNGHEAYYAFKKGFSNVHILDISVEPLELFRINFPDFPNENIYHLNFFDFHKSFDLILEQTFFCAIHPSLRETYSKKMLELLNSGGILAGVLFDRFFDFNCPPFGGTKEEYLTYFDGFEILTFDECYNSIPERAGSELFFQLKKSEI